MFYFVGFSSTAKRNKHLESLHFDHCKVCGKGYPMTHMAQLCICREVHAEKSRVCPQGHVVNEVAGITSAVGAKCGKCGRAPDSGMVDCVPCVQKYCSFCVFTLVRGVPSLYNEKSMSYMEGRPGSPESRQSHPHCSCNKNPHN